MTQEHEVQQHAKSGMMAVIEHLKSELRAIRAGRASSSIVEGITVEAYGSHMKIKELASITTPETRQLIITPFDAHNAIEIAKAIEKANLGVRAFSEGKIVRVVFPELDQNRRKELVNQTHKKREEGKLAIRSVRRDANEMLKQLKSDGSLPEDDIKRLEKVIQDLTDTFCKEADAVTSAKEKEIMTV